jgi:hypothetical protein
MNILLASDLEPTELESYRNILKVFVLGGHSAMIWPRQQKSMFDIWDEYKPGIYIGKQLEEKEASLCAQYGTVAIRAIPLLAADVFVYGRIHKPSDLDKSFFETDYCSIINHNQSEISNLNDYLNKNNKFKLFSQFRYTQTEFCGNIPEDLYVMALSCANTVLATNFLNLFNFTMTNPNTIYPTFSKTDNYSRDKILDEHTCFSGAKNLIEENKLEIDIDIDALYAKFRSENQI